MVEEPLHTIAIIPARGGSKRIRRKNLLSIAGLPLVAYSILHTKQAWCVREVYVSTEDKEIAELARRHGVEVVFRSLELGSDQATSESALLHVLDYRTSHGLTEPDLVVFLQCASSVRQLHDIDRAIETLLMTKGDSLFSACENNQLIWALKDEQLYTLNYDYRKRQREQNMSKQYHENGSVYV